MLSENTAAAPAADPASAAAVAEAPTVAAPRREKRLVPVAPPPRPVRPATAVLVPKKPVDRRPAASPSVLEGRVAASQNPHEILNLVRTEAALRRAQRLSGAGDAQRQTIRLLSIFMLFALLIAAIGAMWYLQTSLQGSRRVHRPAPSPAAQPR